MAVKQERSTKKAAVSLAAEKKPLGCSSFDSLSTLQRRPKPESDNMPSTDYCVVGTGWVRTEFHC